MPSSRNTRLGLMMFINYVAWGAWYVTLDTYLKNTLHFSGTQAGAVFGTTALASMISPFFAGMIADRFFATERVLSALHFIGALLLIALTRVTSFPAVYSIMLAYCICYFPTIALTNSLALKHIQDAGRQFPIIRLCGTIGWIVIGWTIGALALEQSAGMFYLSAAGSLLMCAYSFTLPHTPPAGKGEPVSIRSVLGLDALVMLKRPTYLTFIIVSILACIPVTFYFSFGNAYFNDVHVQNAAGKQTLGQASEVIAMLLLPWFFKHFSVRGILLLGMFSWTARYALMAFGNADAGMWMFYIAILLHGVCFDFLFVTGQLYADQEAPANLRVTAQGFLTFVTYGVGMFLGSFLSGISLDYFTSNHVTDWKPFWLGTSGGSFLILLLIAIFFRTGSRIESGAKKRSAEA
ncbi:MAG TPA: MFS transporter [Bryobacteraceae bacterium]|nr:MFS transporter [Bryobacteraceae bacterium]